MPFGNAIFTNRATVTVQSGTLRFDSQSSFADGTVFNGPGRIMFNGNALLEGTPVLNTTVEMAGGNLFGTFNLNGPTPFEWTGGNILNHVTVNPSGVLNMTGAPSKLLWSGDNANPATITNLGTVVWTNSTRIFLRTAAQVVNQGTWRVDGNEDPFYYDSGGVPTFENRGLLLRSSGDGLMPFGNAIFTNRATVTVQTGTLRFDSQSSFADGSVFNGPGRIVFNGSVLLEGTPVLNTTVEMAGGNLFGTFNLNGPAPFEWTGGTILGRATVNASGVLQILGGNSKLLTSGNNDSPASVLNRGLVTSSNSFLFVRNGSQIVNEGTWQLLSDNSPFYYDSGAVPSFLNRGTFAKANLPGEAILSGVQFRNEAVLSIPLGRLRIPASSVLTSSSVIATRLGGTNALTSHGQLSFDGVGALFGSLSPTLINGFVPAIGDRFSVVTGSSLTGVLSSSNLPSLPSGRGWSLEQSPNRIDLTVETAGDCAPRPANLAMWFRGERDGRDVAGGFNADTNNGVGFGPGRVGNAFVFDGLNDYLTVPDPNAGRFTNLTIEGWFRFSDLNGTRVLASKSFGTGNGSSYIFYTGNGQLCATVADVPVHGASTELCVSPSFQANTWYHLALTFDDESNVLAIYTNGVLAASKSETRTNRFDAHPVVIGSAFQNNGYQYPFAGQIDEDLTLPEGAFRDRDCWNLQRGRDRQMHQ